MSSKSASASAASASFCSNSAFLFFISIFEPTKPIPLLAFNFSFSNCLRFFSFASSFLDLAFAVPFPPPSFSSASMPPVPFPPSLSSSSSLYAGFSLVQSSSSPISTYSSFSSAPTTKFAFSFRRFATSVAYSSSVTWWVR